MSLEVNSFVGTKFIAKHVTNEYLVQIERENCSICFSSFNDNPYRIVSTPVKQNSTSHPHYFHLNCLNSWLKRKVDNKPINTCPVCRADIKIMKAPLNILENTPRLLENAKRFLVDFEHTGKADSLERAYNLATVVYYDQTDKNIDFLLASIQIKRANMAWVNHKTVALTDAVKQANFALEHGDVQTKKEAKIFLESITPK